MLECIFRTFSLQEIEKDIQSYLPGSDVTQKEEEKKDSEKDTETQ